MSETRKPSVTLLMACLSGAISGCTLFLLPELLRGHPAFSVLALVDDSVKNLSAVHVLLLFVAGLTWGCVFKAPYSFYAAVCTVAFLPLVAVIEMLKDHTSHNLWPLEFFFYAVLGLVALLGTTLAWLGKRWFKHHARTTNGMV